MFLAQYYSQNVTMHCHREQFALQKKYIFNILAVAPNIPNKTCNLTRCQTWNSASFLEIFHPSHEPQQKLSEICLCLSVTFSVSLLKVVIFPVFSSCVLDDNCLKLPTFFFVNKSSILQITPSIKLHFCPLIESRFAHHFDLHKR